MTSQCPMDLRNFPMDTQKCLLNIEACKLISYKGFQDYDAVTEKK